MTSPPTINLLISSDGELLLEALSDLGKSSGNLVSKVNELNKAERGGVLLFSNQANPNFISLEHSFLGSEQKIVIKFVDPEGEFETNYFSSGSIYRDLMAKSALERKKNQKYREKRSEAQKSADDLPDVDYEILNKILSRSSTKPIYISYGIGEDSSTWSTVHTAVITGLVFDNNASREFTLTLTPIPRSLDSNNRAGLFGQKVDLDPLGFDLAAEGQSQRIRFENAGTGDYTYSYGPPYQTDYHFLVTDTIVDYIRKATGGANVIVLLPDLNKILDSHITNIRTQESGGNAEDQLRNLIDSLMTSLNLSIKGVPNYKGFAYLPSQYSSLDDATNKSKDLLDALSYKSKKYYDSYDMFVRLASDNSDDKVPDFLEPISKVFSAIKKFSVDGYTLDTVYFLETDLRLLNFWADKSNRSKLTFNGRFIFEENNPTVIIGDPNLIHNFLAPRPEQDKVPLDIVHPINKDELSGKKYTEGIKKITQITQLENSAFGDKSQVPDVFQYKDDILSEESISLIDKNKIPVFRHNTSNPNVLKIKVADEANAYFANLSLGYTKQVNRVATQLVDGKAAVRIRDYKISDLSSLTTAITRSRYSNYGPTMTKKEIIEDVVNRVDSSLEEKIVKGEKYKTVAAYVKAIIDSIDEEKSLQLKISQEVNAEPAVMVDKIATQLAKQTTKISVTTLPLFSISTKTFYQYSPAVVFSQDIPMQGQVFPRRTRFNNYLTGVYQIVGWKHSLGPSKAESLFVLAKVNNSTNLAPIPSERAEDTGLGLRPPTPDDIFTFIEEGKKDKVVEPEIQEDSVSPEEVYDFIKEGSKKPEEEKKEFIEAEVTESEWYTPEERDATQGVLPIREDGTLDDLINREEPLSELWYLRNKQIEDQLNRMGTTGRKRLGDN